MAVTSTGAGPLIQTLAVRLPAVATAGNDAVTAACVSPFDGSIVGCTYIPDATQNGANTNSRTLNLINKGQTGVGSTVAATLPLVSGTNLTAFDESTIPLSGTAGATDLAAGDVLALQSLHVGTGIADPGGLLLIKVSRA